MAMTTPMVTPMMNSDAIKCGTTAELILALALTATIAVAGYHWIATQRAFDRFDKAVPTVFADPKAKQVDARAIAATQKRELTWRPLSQNALNRLLVASRLSGQTTLENRVAAVMRDFAWRTAPGQLNLITIAIERRRFDEVFRHADALTRREKAVEEVLAIFTLYERMPEQRGHLIAALKKSPPWRQAFLASAETITALLKSGEVRRDELSSLLGRMVATGSSEEAYALWTKTQRPDLKPNALFDPDFKQATTLQRSGSPVRFPFEWQLDSGRNAGAQLIEHGDRNEIQLYWNGQGVPIFAKQHFKARPGIYKLTLTGVDASASAQKALVAELVCPRVASVRMLPFPSPRKDQLVFLAERATACGFPEFRLYGRDDSERIDFEMSFTGTELTSAD